MKRAGWKNGRGLTRKAQDPIKVESVRAYSMEELLEAAKPRAPHRVKPMAPTRFQKPTCQPRRVGAGRYHFVWTSSMKRRLEIMLASGVSDGVRWEVMGVGEKGEGLGGWEVEMPRISSWMMAVEVDYRHPTPFVGSQAHGVGGVAHLHRRHVRTAHLRAKRQG